MNNPSTGEVGCDELGEGWLLVLEETLGVAGKLSLQALQPWDEEGGEIVFVHVACCSEEFVAKVGVGKRVCNTDATPRNTLY